jgi:hypothetical protein
LAFFWLFVLLGKRYVFLFSFFLVVFFSSGEEEEDGNKFGTRRKAKLGFGEKERRGKSIIIFSIFWQKKRKKKINKEEV